jgi:tetratricopeptide (TPR) repeat protein
MTSVSPMPEKQQRRTASLDDAVAAYRAGNQRQARELLTHLAKQQPGNVQAWLSLASVSTDPRQARAYVRQALRLDPRNRRAIRGLRQIEAHFPKQASLPRRNTARLLRRWLGIWLLLAAIVIVLGGFVSQAWALRSGERRTAEAVLPAPTATMTPTPSIPERVSPHLPRLEQAWQMRDWQAATNVLNDITLIDSEYPGLRNARCDTYTHWASDWVAKGQIRQAIDLYRRAIPFCGQDKDIQNEKALALTYLSGEWRYARQRWQAAATALQAVYDIEPDYAQAQSLLYTAYISSSHELLAAGELDEARLAAQGALALKVDSDEAQALLNEIRARATPTPVPTSPGRKRIEVNISEQRMYVWEGETLIYKWVCSTGEPGRNTATGRFAILDKIPEAWASTWRLRMPYWMGIYWAGSLENGIHALPINPNGTRLWEGYLGSRVSYGCIILSTENARTLYNWAPIGTPVWVHY